jgi:hypothetical protein
MSSGAPRLISSNAESTSASLSPSHVPAISCSRAPGADFPDAWPESVSPFDRRILPTTAKRPIAQHVEQRERIPGGCRDKSLPCSTHVHTSPD